MSWQLILFSTILLLWVIIFPVLTVMYYRQRNHIVLKWRLPTLTMMFGVSLFILDVCYLTQEISLRLYGRYPCQIINFVSAMFPIPLLLGALKGNQIVLNYNAFLRKTSKLALFLQPKVRNGTLIALFLICVVCATVFMELDSNVLNSSAGRECHYETGNSIYLVIGSYSIGFPFFLHQGIKILKVRDRWNIAAESVFAIFPMSISTLFYLIITAYYRFTDNLAKRYEIENSMFGFILFFTFTSIFGQLLLYIRPLYLIYFNKFENYKIIEQLVVKQTELQLTRKVHPTNTSETLTTLSAHPSAATAHKTNLSMFFSFPDIESQINIDQNSKGIRDLPENLRLNAILADSVMCCQLERFAQKSFSSELILFAKDCEELIRIGENCDILFQMEWLKRCREAFDLYIKDNALLEINVSSLMKTTLQKVICDANVKNFCNSDKINVLSALRSVHNEICSLIQNNLLHGFLNKLQESGAQNCTHK